VDREWRVLCVLAAHKPAHGHGHYHAHGGLEFYHTHIKHTPKSRCAICSGFEDTTKMSSRSRGTCPGDLAGDRRTKAMGTVECGVGPLPCSTRHIAHCSTTIAIAALCSTWRRRKQVHLEPTNPHRPVIGFHSIGLNTKYLPTEGYCSHHIARPRPMQSKFTSPSSQKTPLHNQT
jgi:hypothetical protein